MLPSQRMPSVYGRVLITMLWVLRLRVYSNNTNSSTAEGLEQCPLTIADDSLTTLTMFQPLYGLYVGPTGPYFFRALLTITHDYMLTITHDYILMIQDVIEQCSFLGPRPQKVHLKDVIAELFLRSETSKGTSIVSYMDVLFESLDFQGIHITYIYIYR